MHIHSFLILSFFFVLCFMFMKLGGGGGGGSSDTTIHVAAPIQDTWNVLVDWAYGDGTSGSDRALQNTIGLQPYQISLSDVNDAFLDFHTNFFNVFMVNVDILALNTQIQGILINSPVIADSIAAQNTYLEDDLNQVQYPKLRAFLSDMDAVMTSAFLDTQAILMINKTKTISKYSADLRITAWQTAQDIWTKYLTWNQNIVQQYMAELQNYYACAIPYWNAINSVSTNNALWPWTILDQMRAIVGCLNGAPAGHNTQYNPSGLQTAGQYVGMAAGIGTTAAMMSKAGMFGAGTSQALGGASAFNMAGTSYATIDAVGSGVLATGGEVAAGTAEADALMEGIAAIAVA